MYVLIEKKTPNIKEMIDCFHQSLTTAKTLQPIGIIPVGIKR